MKGDSVDPRWSRIDRGERLTLADQGVAKPAERIPFLLSPASGKGAFPLVVYISGRGEMGGDLKRMFHQTGVFDAVRDPAFQDGTPCHLLAIMPPDYATGYQVHHPHSYGACMGGGLDIRLGNYHDGLANLHLIRVYADLIFAVQRRLASQGAATVDLDAIVLTGFGTGSTAVSALMREYPGRYAGACVTYPSTHFLPYANPYRPGRWWYAMSEAYHQVDDLIDAMAAAYRTAGAEIRLDFYPDGPGWWNRQYASPEFKAWLSDCFDKGPLHGARLVVSRQEPAKELLMARTGPDEVTYYGTGEELPGGLPAEVADRRVSDLKGVRYLYIDGRVRDIPPEAFCRSPDLETVHFDGFIVTNAETGVSYPVSSLTNVARRAFAESPRLNLVVFSSGESFRIAGDAFEGCATNLYGATPGIPISRRFGYTRGTNTTIVATERIDLETYALPVDGLCRTHIFGYGGRRLHVDGEFLWAEDGNGAKVLMHLGDGRDVTVPATLGGRSVTALEKNLLPKRGGFFEYRSLTLPSSVRTAANDPEGRHRLRYLFAPAKLPDEVVAALAPDEVVYGTAPEAFFAERSRAPLPAGMSKSTVP